MQCTNHPERTTGLVPCRRCGRPFCRDCVVNLRGFRYCGDCKGDQVRDIQSGTEADVLPLASVSRRFAGLWLDSMLLGVVLMVPAFVFIFSTVDTTGPGQPNPAAGRMTLLVTIGMIGVWIVYEGLMLAHGGQTLGKKAVGIKVVTPEGQDIGAGQSWGRAVLRQVFFSYLSLINYLPAVFTKKKTCLHDLICKTRVVRVRR